MRKEVANRSLISDDVPPSPPKAQEWPTPADVAAEAEQMRTELLSRAVIDPAKGVLMGQCRCTADEAFALLTTISQDSNRKLRDVAAVLVDTDR